MLNIINTQESNFIIKYNAHKLNAHTLVDRCVQYAQWRNEWWIVGHTGCERRVVRPDASILPLLVALPSTACKTGSYSVWILWLNEGSASGGAERVKHRHNRRRFQLCSTLCMHLKDSKILTSAWHEFPEKQKIREMKSGAWHSHWGLQKVLVSQRAQMAVLYF